MNIKTKAMGDYQTNCYIIEINGKELIIDPGIGATDWVKKNVKNPIAILNTHGHFDHIWSNSELKKIFKIPIYCPKGDAFMLENDPFSYGTPPSKADILVNGDKEFNLDGIRFKYHLFAGHTPGTSAIEIGDVLFSGDFIFQNSIGRVDFPFSSPSEMKKSIKKILLWNKDYTIYTGHGAKTKLFKEKSSLKKWLNYI